MADQARARRMSVRVREIVAEVIERQVKDPRLGMVTVTDTRMTPDLREATVFYTVWGDDNVRADTAQALESAKGVIRSAVGRGTGLKHTPAWPLGTKPASVSSVTAALGSANRASRRAGTGLLRPSSASRNFIRAGASALRGG